MLAAPAEPTLGRAEPALRPFSARAGQLAGWSSASPPPASGAGHAGARPGGPWRLCPRGGRREEGSQLGAWGRGGEEQGAGEGWCTVSDPCAKQALEGGGGGMRLESQGQMRQPRVQAGCGPGLLEAVRVLQGRRQVGVG